MTSSGFNQSAKTTYNQSEITFTLEQLNSKSASTIKSVLAAGLYPNIASVTHVPKVDSVANPEKLTCIAETPQGAIQVHPSSVNRYLGANGWLAYHEKVSRYESNPYPTQCVLISGTIQVDPI